MSVTCFKTGLPTLKADEVDSSWIFAVILGQGLGLIGGYAPGTRASVGQWPTLLLILTVFVLQVVFSNRWFKHHEIGPVEWAWRSLTWFRLQPFRKK